MKLLVKPMAIKHKTDDQSSLWRKKVYTSPQLKKLGDVHGLTRGSNAGEKNDMSFGMRNGHDGICS